NKLPSSAIPLFNSPHHALFKSQPDYSLLRTFGCLCFPHLRPYNKHKLQFRSSPCVYLGISPQHKGHKCLDSTGRIYISKDVIFHESQFPYLSLFPSSVHNTQQSNGHYPAHILFPSPATYNVPQPTSPMCNPQSTSPVSPSLSTSPATPTPTSPLLPSLPIGDSSTLIPNDSSPPAITTQDTVPAVNKTRVVLPAVINPQVISDHNNHSMVTRGKTGNLKPKVFLAELEPKTVRSALNDPKWLQAMQT
ncbi:retrovirus-related pol polyprotein from transposon TNT 1-94, partial [Trifolium medium]|nr:retrovirus-related pol polyprotein from transposon TNT 1-94 [Trifolium medium]